MIFLFLFLAEHKFPTLITYQTNMCRTSSEPAVCMIWCIHLNSAHDRVTRKCISKRDQIVSMIPKLGSLIPNFDITVSITICESFVKIWKVGFGSIKLWKLLCPKWMSVFSYADVRSLFTTYSSCVRGHGERRWPSSCFQWVDRRLVLIKVSMYGAKCQ